MNVDVELDQQIKELNEELANAQRKSQGLLPNHIYSFPSQSIKNRFSSGGRSSSHHKPSPPVSQEIPSPTNKPVKQSLVSRLSNFFTQCLSFLKNLFFAPFASKQQ